MIKLIVIQNSYYYNLQVIIIRVVDVQYIIYDFEFCHWKSYAPFNVSDMN